MNSHTWGDRGKNRFYSFDSSHNIWGVFPFFWGGGLVKTLRKIVEVGLVELEHRMFLRSALDPIMWGAAFTPPFALIC